MNKLFSIILIPLLFFLFSKFIAWYPNFNTFLFYFLAFWFTWSIRLIPSRLNAIKTDIIQNKSIGFSFYVTFKFGLLIVSLAYFIHTIFSNISLYKNWAILGLIAFVLFIILSTLTIISSILMSRKFY
jgi:hypothetical protein